MSIERKKKAKKVARKHKTSHSLKLTQPGSFVKLSEVQAELGCHIAHVRKMCRAGQLPAQRIGGRWFVVREQWEQLKRGQWRGAA